MDNIRGKVSMKIKNTIRTITPVTMDSDHFPVVVSNIGISSRDDDLSVEIIKAKTAIDAGADIISDLSLVENVAEVQKRYLDIINVPFSAVSIYETFCKNIGKRKLVAEDFIVDFEKQAMRGIDLLTLHATVFKEDMRLIEASKRHIPTTSRGGVMMLRCLQRYGYENPYYEYFDDVLKIAKKYDICLSLGPMYRPGSVWDCQYENNLHFVELSRMGELVGKANAANVGIAIEGIGHAPLNVIPSLISEAKKVCSEAPYRVLTVSTDTAMGYDHISSAIASSVAVQYGADSITCVTRSEHLGLPTIEDIRESVICARIAAESGYRARKKEFPLDYLASSARSKFGCGAMSEGFMFMDELITINRGEHKGQSCGMCGDFCPFLILDEMKSNANL